MQLEPRYVAKLIYETDPRWRDAKLLVVGLAIVWGESGGISNSRNHNTNGSTDRGLWQINTVHKNMSDAECDDPVKATRFAYNLWLGRGGKFTDWAAYNNGSYRRYYRLAVRGVANYLAQHYGLVPTPFFNFPPIQIT